MARTRKIAPEMAVNAAMQQFWKHGYSGIGTRQLEDETGITRFTLQTSYGGKMPLYLTALDSYLDAFEANANPNMTDGQIETLAQWFEMRSNPPIFAEMSHYGCFLLNSTVEFASQNAEINLRTQRFYTMVEKGFMSALTSIKTAGNVAPSFDIKAMSNVLLSSTIGLNIVIRAAANNAAGETMANSIATLIRSWQTK